MMKKTLTLTENELFGVIKRISEQVNFNDYSSEDFIDVFLQVFRPWITQKLGEDAKKYPMSWLLKKYGQEFTEDKGLVHRGSRDEFDPSYYSLEHYGKELVKKSHYELPQLYQEEKFMEKYKKMIPHFVDMLKLPSFIRLNFKESEPNRVLVGIDVDFGEWMKYPKLKTVEEYEIITNLKKLFSDFGGVEFGNPAHGEVHMSWVRETNSTTDEWVKNELNKIIKKKIRESDRENTIRAIKFTPSRSGGNITLMFKSNLWSGKYETGKSTNNVIRQLGYGPNLTVDF
jgi:hypothetical protein